MSGPTGWDNREESGELHRRRDPTQAEARTIRMQTLPRLEVGVLKQTSLFEVGSACTRVVDSVNCLTIARCFDLSGERVKARQMQLKLSSLTHTHNEHM